MNQLVMKGKKITMAGAFVSYEGQKKLVSYEGQKICYIVMNQLVMNGKKITMAGGFVSYKGQRQTKEKKKHNEKKKVWNTIMKEYTLPLISMAHKRGMAIYTLPRKFVP